jgi:DNA-binding response OmpR family regulator
VRKTAESGNIVVFDTERPGVMNETILLVEDDEETLDLLARALRRNGLMVLTAQTGEEGLELIRRHRPHVTILDLILPDISGDVICAAVRADQQIAHLYILMLTGLATAADRVAGFELGADDYVTKPCDIREIVLRVHAALRRIKPPPPKAVDAMSVVGPIRVDHLKCRAFVGRRECALSRSEHAVLLALARHPGQLFSRRQLLKIIKTAGTKTERGCVEKHIKRLRLELGTAGRALESVRGSGYRMSVVA